MLQRATRYYKYLFIMSKVFFLNRAKKSSKQKNSWLKILVSFSKKLNYLFENKKFQ